MVILICIGHPKRIFLSNAKQPFRYIAIIHSKIYFAVSLFLFLPLTPDVDHGI